MIDQTKDKKDDVVAQKLENKKQDAALAQKLAQEEKEKAELSKQQKGNQQLKAQPDNNTANAMQPIGSAQITTDKAEIKSEPNQAGSLIGSFSAQQKVDILEQKGNELKVLVNGKVGYIAAGHTDYKGSDKADKNRKDPTGAATVSASALNIRKGPGKDQPAIGTLRQGDKVNIYGEKDGYLEVNVGGQIGYISAEFTDHAGKNKGKSIQPKEGKGLEQAPEALQELLSKETLTAAEIAQARDLIAQAPESARPELYEALQTKPGMQDKDNKDAHPESATDYANLAASLELLGVQNPSHDMSYTAYLEQLKRDQKLPENGGMQNWGSLANAMGVNYRGLCMPGDRKSLEWNFWSDVVREQLRQGHAIMTCIQNITVRIEAVDDKGLVITLPESNSVGFSGLGSGWQAYNGKAEQKGKGKRGLLTFEALSAANLQWVIALG